MYSVRHCLFWGALRLFTLVLGEHRREESRYSSSCDIFPASTRDDTALITCHFTINVEEDKHGFVVSHDLPQQQTSIVQECSWLEGYDDIYCHGGWDGAELMQNMSTSLSIRVPLSRLQEGLVNCQLVPNGGEFSKCKLETPIKKKEIPTTGMLRNTKMTTTSLPLVTARDDGQDDYWYGVAVPFIILTVVFLLLSMILVVIVYREARWILNNGTVGLQSFPGRGALSPRASNGTVQRENQPKRNSLKIIIAMCIHGEPAEDRYKQHRHTTEGRPMTACLPDERNQIFHPI